jgi:hypothetical protein
MTLTMTNRIRNFRPASGFIIALDKTDDKSAASSSTATLASTVYRCGSTDMLGREEKENETTATPRALSSSSFVADDQIVYQHAGLIIDLRSPAERNDEDAQRWMENSSASVTSSSTSRPAQQQRPIHVFTIPIDDDEESSSVIAELHEKIFDDDKNSRRYVIRLDVLNRQELLRYIQNNWLSLKKNASFLLTPETNSSNHHLASHNITEELNKRGLAGLNEAILETKSGQIGLCRALQIMTVYREAIASSSKKNKLSVMDAYDTSIVIHCVQGKDR